MAATTESGGPMAPTTGGRYEAREVTRLGVPLVEIVWIPQGGPAGAALCAVTADRIPMIAEALARYLAADPVSRDLG
jgi:hypothetical protein